MVTTMEIPTEKWSFLVQNIVAFGFLLWVLKNGWDTNVWHVYGWVKNPHTRNNVKRINNGIKAQNMEADQYIYTWWYIMMASMGCWIECWSEEMIHRNNGIIMECNIITTDALLDLEVCITGRTQWLRVRIYVVQYITSSTGDTWKNNTGIFQTLSPMQIKNHKGHETIWVPQIDSPMC